MYYQLTEAIKRRAINECKRCFVEYFPKHQDIIDFIQTNYAFSQRPQKGVVVSINGANPERLSADNFQGTVISHVALSQVDQYPGHSVEWVKEDRLVVEEQSSFPSPPGIYYLDIFSKGKLKEALSDSEFQSVLDEEGDKSYYFYVDPLLSKKKEPLVEPTENNDLKNKTIYVTEGEFFEDSIDVYTRNYSLTSAPYLELNAEESIEVLEDQDEIGLERGFAPVEAVGGEQETFDITPGVNDELKFRLNGKFVEVQLDPGFRLASNIVEDIRDELQDLKISSRKYDLFTQNGRVGIEAAERLEFLDGSQSTANDTLGFEKGFSSPSLKSNLFVPHVEHNTSLKVSVDGKRFEIPLYEGEIILDELANRLEGATGQRLSVSHDMGGDYVAYPDEGKIELLKDFSRGTRIMADYKYPSESRGPFGTEERRSNNEAIPGVILAFGSRVKDRDKQAVVVHDERRDVALEYGGRWNLDVNLDIITRDPLTRSEITDGLLTYFFSLRKGSLSEEGIEITDISSGGESEETYQDSEGQIYFLNSISLSLRTDWAIHIAKPLVIERVRPVTREGYDLEVAGKDEEEIYQDASDVEPTENIALEKAENIYFVGKTKDFERIK